MKPPFELIYGYQHCMGRTQYIAGHADSEAAARRWVREHTCEGASRVRVPAEDPVCWCPVAHCHMKRQRPWFGYRSADGALTITPSHKGRWGSGREHHGIKRA